MGAPGEGRSAPHLGGSNSGVTGSGVDLGVAHALLRTHVREGPDREPGLGQPPLGFARRFGDPEVTDESVARLEEDVLGLEVPVHDATLMCVSERASRPRR